MKTLHRIQTNRLEIGQALIPLNRILSAPLKRTTEAEVRVYEDYVDIKDSQTGQFKGSLRVLVNLGDIGASKVASNPVKSLQRAREESTQQKNQRALGGTLMVATSL